MTPHKFNLDINVTTFTEPLKLNSRENSYIHQNPYLLNSDNIIINTKQPVDLTSKGSIATDLGFNNQHKDKPKQMSQV